MIFLNGDILQQKAFDTNKCVPYKGKISNTLLVIEDIIDLARKNPDNHRCLCKCLRCGRLYSRLVPIAEIRKQIAECHCTAKFSHKYRFLDKRAEMLKFLVAERNRAKQEAVFAEDLERVYYFDMLVKFIESKSLKQYFVKELDLT